MRHVDAASTIAIERITGISYSYCTQISKRMSDMKFQMRMCLSQKSYGIPNIIVRSVI